jgi:hypothetical protein
MPTVVTAQRDCLARFFVRESLIAWLTCSVSAKKTPPMSIWTRAVTSPQTDERIRAAGGSLRRALVLAIIFGVLALWTYAVRGFHDYARSMSGWSDGASKRAADDWTPFIILWCVQVLLVGLICLMIRAPMAKKNEPNQSTQRNSSASETPSSLGPRG